jgi:hypothetical protein
MDFYVHVGTILIELKDKTAAIGTKNLNYTIVQFTSSLLGTED